MQGSKGVRVQLLGGLSVFVGAEEVTSAIGGRVGRLAFAYLVLNRRRPVRRDELAAAIWEARAPADPDAALRVVLTRLRKALGANALQGRAELRLELPEPVEVDVERVRAAADPAAVAAMTDHELLPGLEADWISAERDALEAIRFGALLASGETALSDGDPGLAERVARRLIALAPFRESGHQLLIEALVARGEQAEALRAYEDLRQLLRDELGSAPSAELAELHTKLLRESDETERRSGAAEEQLPPPAAVQPEGRPALAGRGQELEQLEAARHGVEHEHRLFLVGGEPGIGKSRLAAELGRRRHDAGDNVLWGRCHEEALVPYEPFVEALRQYAAALSDEQLARLAHAAGTEFLALAPDLARRLPRAALAPTADEAQARRYRLFESVAEVLTLAAAARPLVMVLEDLHWADQGTTLLLGHILRRHAVAPVVFVGTYRTTEVDDEHPLHALPQADRIELGGLKPEETTQIVAELTPDSGLAERIHAETEGNPLFVVEALRAVADSGETEILPRRISDVIDRRLRRLSADAGTVLGVGAVLGRSFTLAEVGRISGLPQDRLLDSVEQAIRARLIEEVASAPQLVTFTHALIREVRYQQHSAARRVALHDAAAEAISALYAGELDNHLADLASHLEAAVTDQSSARAAVEALRQAGEQAAERQAFEDAAGWLTRARALFEIARPSPAGRCDVLLALAEALRASDRIEEARAAASEAADRARELGDGERLARAALAFVGSHLVFKAGRPDVEDITLLEEAVEALGSGASSVRVRLLARLCTAIYYSERFDDVPVLAARALELATADGDEDALGWAQYARFWAALEPDGAREAAVVMERLAPIAARTKSLELASEAAMVQWYGLLRAGRPDLLKAELEQSRDRIAATGIPIYLWFADAIATVIAVTEGRFDEAQQMIDEVAQRGAAIDRHDLPRFATMPMLQLRHHQGRLGELVDVLRYVVENNPGLPLWRAVLLEALTAAGAGDEAEALLHELSAESFAWLRRDVNWLWAITTASSACVRLGDRRVGDVLYRLLDAIPEQSVVMGPALGFLGPVSRYLGPLAALTGRHDDADRHFGNAIAHLERVGAAPLADATRAERERLLARS